MKENPLQWHNVKMDVWFTTKRVKTISNVCACAFFC